MRTWCLLLLLFAATCPSQDAGGFARAIEARAFAFPADHGNHPRYRTEWWYFTGVLHTEAGAVLGYQATWFRSAVTERAVTRRSRLGMRDVFFFHGALTDVGARAFHFDQAVSRGASSWASAATGKLNLNLLGRRIETATGGAWRLRTVIQGRRLDLTLTPERPALLHGEAPGLSLKGSSAGEASYYMSHTRLRTEGTAELQPGGPAVRVSGRTWFDHEFGSAQLASDSSGWDWFSVALDDGTDLMIYAIRKQDGTMQPMSAGTLRTGSGRRRHLGRKDFALEVLDHWKSPATGGRYPCRWRLRVPGEDIDLEVRPVLAGQELRTPETTGVNYWEGLCRFAGSVGNSRVEGYGYVELVGYAGAFRAGI